LVFESRSTDIVIKARFFAADGGKTIRDIVESAGEPFLPEMVHFSQAREIGVHSLWQLQLERNLICRKALEMIETSGFDAILCTFSGLK
jgi:amidase